jgi:hypothetical protein
MCDKTDGVETIDGRTELSCVKVNGAGLLFMVDWMLMFEQIKWTHWGKGSVFGS